MNKKLLYAIIFALCALFAWREYTRSNAIDQAIQETSDDLLAACESRIDEILGQF